MKIQNKIAKSLKIKVLAKPDLRPTKSRICASIFDVLRNKISFNDYTFYDLFAGSGSVGITALNQSFNQSVFFERDREIFLALKNNLAKLSSNLKFKLYFGDVFYFLQKKTLFQKNKPHIFFIDAPFSFNFETNLLGLIKKIAFKQDFLIIEKNRNLTELLKAEKYNLFCLKSYGKIYLHFIMF